MHENQQGFRNPVKLNNRHYFGIEFDSYFIDTVFPPANVV